MSRPTNGISRLTPALSRAIGVRGRPIAVIHRPTALTMGNRVAALRADPVMHMNTGGAPRVLLVLPLPSFLPDVESAHHPPVLAMAENLRQANSAHWTQCHDILDRAVPVNPYRLGGFGTEDFPWCNTMDVDRRLHANKTSGQTGTALAVPPPLLPDEDLWKVLCESAWKPRARTTNCSLARRYHVVNGVPSLPAGPGTARDIGPVGKGSDAASTLRAALLHADGPGYCVLRHQQLVASTTTDVGARLDTARTGWRNVMAHNLDGGLFDPVRIPSARWRDENPWALPAAASLSAGPRDTQVPLRDVHGLLLPCTKTGAVRGSCRTA